MDIKSNLTIISGGQTGVDRAALDFALANNITCGGWCPQGRIAEDGPIHKIYPLKETNSSDFLVRTKKNIQDSDGTFIIYRNNMDVGTELTLNLCEKLNKPVLIYSRVNTISATQFSEWLNLYAIQTLNIAGPRESNEVGIYKETISTFKVLLC